MKNFLLKSISIVYLNFFLTSLIGYINRIIYAKELSVEEYGMFFAAYSFIGFFVAFRDLGLSEALMFFVPRWKLQNKLQKIKSSLLFTMLVQFLVASIVFIGIYLFKDIIIAKIFSGNTKALLYLLPLAIWFIILGFSEPIINVLQSFKKFNWTAWSQTISISIVLIFTIISFNFFKDYFAFGWILSAFALTIIYSFLIFKKIDWKEAKINLPDKNTKKELITYSLPLIIVTTSGVLTNNINTIILSIYADMRSVALFHIALPIAGILPIALAQLNPVIIPLISESSIHKDTTKIKEILKFFYNSFCALFLAFIIILIFNSEVIISLIFGSKYLEASLYLKILFVTFFIQVFNNFNFTYISYTSKATKLKAKLSIYTLLTTILLGIPMTIMWNTLGASMAYLLTTIITFFISIYYLQKKIPLFPYITKSVSIVLINIIYFYISSKIITNELLSTSHILLISYYILNYLIIILIQVSLKFIDIKTIKDLLFSKKI